MITFRIGQCFFILAVAGAFFVGTPSAFAWTEPLLGPPFGNVAAPLNVSITDQTKAGALNVEGGMTISNNESGGLVGMYITAPDSDGLPTTALSAIGGAAPESSNLSTGVFGMTTSGAIGSGRYYGVYGLAGMNTGNAVAVFGYAGLGNDNAYAGYFRGSTRMEGNVVVAEDPDTNTGGGLSAQSLCLLGHCLTSWASILPEAWLFQETSPNNTVLVNTNSRLFVGGTNDSDSSFVFKTWNPDEFSTFYTPGSVVIGAPPVVAPDNICQQGEICGSGNPDCWGQKANCSNGLICDPNGSGNCVPFDQSPPVGGSVAIIDATPNNVVCRRGVAQDYGSGVKDYHFYFRQGSYVADAGQYQDLGYSIAPDYENVDIGSQPDTEFTCVVGARDWALNEQAFADAPHDSATTPVLTCTSDLECAGTPRPFCCDGNCEFNCSGTPPGGSPVFLKFEDPIYPCIPENPDYPDCLTRPDEFRPIAAVAGPSRLSRIRDALGSVGEWVQRQFTKHNPLEAPPVHAAGQFGGDEPVRLTINHGVLRIIGGTSSVAEMEIGNNGTDIASTGNIYIRPNLSNQGSYFVSSGSGGSTVQNLVLTGELQAATATVAGAITENNMPLLSLAAIPSKEASSCNIVCSTAGKACFASENPDPNTTNWLGCDADGNTWPLGAQCLCVGVSGSGFGSD